MNIVSCDNCGIVIDIDKLNLDDDFYYTDYGINTDYTIHVGMEFYKCVRCPVCKEKIDTGVTLD